MFIVPGAVYLCAMVSGKSTVVPVRVVDLGLFMLIETGVAHLLPGDVVGHPALLGGAGPRGHVLHHLYNQ